MGKLSVKIKNASTNKVVANPKPVEGCKFVSRDLMGVNPNSQQFEPTPGEGAVPQRFKMGGGC